MCKITTETLQDALHSVTGATAAGSVYSTLHLIYPFCQRSWFIWSRQGQKQWAEGSRWLALRHSRFVRQPVWPYFHIHHLCLPLALEAVGMTEEVIFHTDPKVTPTHISHSPTDIRSKYFIIFCTGWPAAPDVWDFAWDNKNLHMRKC